MNKDYLLCGMLLISVVLVGCGDGSIESIDAEDVGSQIAVGQKMVDEAQNSVEPEPIIEDEVVALLSSMAVKLSGLQQFSVTMLTSFDVLQSDGYKLEFGSHRTAEIFRPDKARFTFEQRTGDPGKLLFTGTDIYAYNVEENVYATAAQPGDIDESLDLVTRKFEIPVPASDFFAADLAIAEDLIEASDLGASRIGGHSARHVEFRKPGIHVQLWISEENLPLRIVTLYHEAPGQPQFRAQFLDWDTEPDYTDEVFKFSPPEGSVRIRFASIEDTEADAAENAEGETR